MSGPYGGGPQQSGPWGPRPGQPPYGPPGQQPPGRPPYGPPPEQGRPPGPPPQGRPPQGAPPGYGQPPRPPQGPPPGGRPAQAPSGGFPAQRPPYQQQQPSGGFPAQQQYQSPGGQGPAQYRTEQPKKNRANGLVLGAIAVAVLLAIVAVLLFLWPGWAVTTTFDAKSLDTGVTQVLQAKGKPVQNVRCPENEPVKNGTTFTCDVTADGQPKKVTITVVGEDKDPPEYQVGDPQ